jgi:murein hydrolase activator
MRRALPASLLALSLAAAGPLQAQAPSRPLPAGDSARRRSLEAEQARAEQARAAQLAAQKEAAARASAASNEERRLATQRVAAAARLREAETATADAAARMDALARAHKDAEARLQARAEDFAPLLPLIERLSLYPAETMLAVPASPEDALRGVLVLQGLAREIEQQAASLRREQAEVDRAAQEMQAEAPKLGAAQASQAAQALALDREIAAAQASRRAAGIDADEAARAAATQAARADSLRTAIAEIEAARRASEERAGQEASRAARRIRETDANRTQRRTEVLASPAGASPAGASPAGAGPGGAGPIGTLGLSTRPRGQLATPVAGTVVRSWGEATDAGPATGLSYRAAPSAHVVSPCSGRVVFAAPFRSYGLLLIVDCGGGYHFVLAGLERIDVSVGNALQVGEPVGVMPGWDPKMPGSRPALYVELRRDGQPVNPAPWLRARG